MRLLIQRVSRASVSIEGKLQASIEQGLLVLFGVHKNDTADLIPRLAQKLVELRIFSDDQGKMNLSVTDVKGAILIISQFTLHADCRRGRRPDFTASAPAGQANALYEEFIAKVKTYGLPVRSGVFAAEMQVALVNDGPVTIILDSGDLR